MKMRFLMFALLTLICAPSFGAGGGGGNSLYLPLGSPFVVNIKDHSGIRFLQITSEARLTDPAVGDEVKHHMALIRHIMIMLFSQQTPQSIGNLEGKEKLREQTLAAVQTALQEETGKDLIENIYFTGFVVQ
ncbi:MAG: flagellar basal body-associated FliL family protein [Gammaproteobacteria bacterium]|nr:flagellar basal body-associated FliL family protein [Gammaproteobacteria bacterium]MDH5799438.1 flagellar basal body-associated FliL family protein [Gammaproteobacteria bacterium]